MMQNKLPRASGVYQISCIPTRKVYVGSAIDLHDRWIHHRQSLRRGDHHNGHLQNAWDKYGEEAFEFTVLELVEPSDLLQAEQEWLETTGCTDRAIGFNVYDTAGSPGDANVQIWEGFISPDGKPVTITNPYGFCRQNGLDWASMHRLAMGKSKLKSYKGWTHENSKRQRDYVKTFSGFIDPEGTPVGPITNLAAFCRKHGLENSHMVAVAHGRLYSHRNWTYNNDREYRGHKTYTGFINPDGVRVNITNLSAFCRANNLSSVHMRQLMSGQRKSHKGWIWSRSDEKPEED